jgi:diguanylate cyclase (GGDEF)-like protein
LIVIDLDQFKAVNDRDGHLAGDRTLRDFSAALLEVTRPDDIAIRSGGDEFVLILPKTDPSGAHALASRLRTAASIEWSYGVAQWAADEGFDAAMARADQRMYKQKTERAAVREAAAPQ